MALIAVDIDDVLLPFYSSLAAWHNEQTGNNVSADSLLEGPLSESWGGPTEYWVKQCNDFHSTGGSAAIEIYDDARVALDVLASDNEIFLLTSRPGMHREHTEGWMQRHLDGVTDQLIMCEQTTPEGGSRHMDKGLIAKEAGADVLIDDAVHYIERSNAAGVRGILFGDYSWNRDHHDKHEHAKDWADVLKLLGYDEETRT